MNLIKNILKESNNILKKNYFICLSIFLFFISINFIVIFLLDDFIFFTYPFLIPSLSFFTSILFFYIAKYEKINFFDRNIRRYFSLTSFFKFISFIFFIIFCFVIIIFVSLFLLDVLYYMTDTLDNFFLYIFFFNIVFLYVFTFIPIFVFSLIIFICLLFYPSIFLYFCVDIKLKYLIKNIPNFFHLIKDNIFKIFLLEMIFLIFKIFIVLSFGLLSLWLIPLTYIARAKFYIYLSEGYCFKYEALEINKLNLIEQ